MDDNNLFNLMIHSDIDTLNNICLTRNIYWCHHNHFGKAKFAHDKLPILTPILHNTFITWQREYRRTDIAAKEAIHVLDNINNGMITCLFSYSNKIVMFNDIFNILFNNFVIYKSYNNLCISYNIDHYHIRLGENSINVNEPYLYNALTIIFYKYPRINFNYTIPRPTLPI